MAKGWTCGRCAANNDEGSVSCRSCGMIRGGVVTTPNPVTPGAGGAPEAPGSGGWSSEPIPVLPPLGPGEASPGGWPGAPVPVSSPSRKSQLATGILANVGVRIGILVLFVAIAGVIGWFTNAGRNSSGEINKAGELSATDLQVGDCYDLQGDSSTFDPNATIEKTNAMPCTQAHHYEVFYVGKMTDSGTYPTQDDFQAWSNANCAPAFQAYVGLPIDQSSLTFYVFFPEQGSWAQGDRGMQCSLADANLQPLTQSLKGSAK